MVTVVLTQCWYYGGPMLSSSYFCVCNGYKLQSIYRGKGDKKTQLSLVFLLNLSSISSPQLYWEVEIYS